MQGELGFQMLASIDDWKTRLTIAAMMATEPWWQGRRKCTVSTEAVTTGPRATVLAARPAQMSIQLSTWNAHTAECQAARRIAVGSRCVMKHLRQGSELGPAT